MINKARQEAEALFRSKRPASELGQPLPPTPPVDGAPITDVNTLPVVSASVAAQIKAAAGLSVAAAAAPLPPTLAALLLTHRKSLNRSTGRELQVVPLARARVGKKAAAFLLLRSGSLGTSFHPANERSLALALVVRSAVDKAARSWRYPFR